jgi:hypothetical protein
LGREDHCETERRGVRDKGNEKVEEEKEEREMMEKGKQ